MKFTFIIVLLSYCLTINAQSKPWTHIDKSQLESGLRDKLHTLPRAYSAFELDGVKMRTKLISAPHENMLTALNKSNFEVELPTADGELANYIIWESPVMESEIASRYPGIKSFKGYNKNNPHEHMRMTLTSGGIHAATIENGQMSYIDPVQDQSGKYIAYQTKDAIDQSYTKELLCGTDDGALHSMREKMPKWGVENRSLGDKAELRKYRLALACAGEWGQARGTKEKALEEMNAFVDRANLVFEKEVGLRLVIINDNDDIIFLNPLSDPYNTPESGGGTVGQHTGILNNLIGGSKYDVGHVFLPCTDVGGVAAGLICSPGKGNGVTCYHSQGVNAGTVLVFNHEVGHQMTAGHTWNHCVGNEGQLALGSAFEPGSGSTIMSYAFACGTDNLGINREGYYHSGTIEQMLQYTNRENSEAYICAEKVDFENFIPEIEIITPENVFIPISTPFYLLGSAEDRNNDPMTYIWEQVDADVSVPLGQPLGNCPLFRSYKSTVANAIRLFPPKQSIFNKNFTDVKEMLPTYTRDMNFRFCVRDNNPQVNGVAMKDIKFKVSDAAGPFAMTEPITNVKYKAGKTYSITWDVAKTDQAPVNAKFVDILIGYGNSLEFGSDNVVMIAERVPNTGQANIKIPERETSSARIIVRGHKNIFFTVSAGVTIEAPEGPSHYSSIPVVEKSACIPTPITFNIETSSINNLTDSIRFEVLQGLPSNAVTTFEKSQGVLPGESNKLIINIDSVKGTANYEVIIRTFVNGIDTIDRYVYLNLTGTDLNDVKLKLPAASATGIAPTQRYEWEAKTDATSYTLQVATSPAFEPGDIVITRTTAGLAHLSETYLDKAKVYFWRVRSSNSCGDGEWSEINTFATAILKCQKVESGNLAIPISGSGMPVIEAPIVVFESGIINDVNISNIDITHTQSGDLSAFLISPSGTKVKLWANKCGTTQNVNVGLDDDSNLFFACPINTGRTYRPEEKLNAFNGQNMEGRWILRVEDNKSGGNGRFNDYNMELCAEVALAPPVLVKNDTLKIYPKNSRNIVRSLLLTEDSQSPTDKINYTLVDLPLKGTLVLGGSPLQVGAKFTQAQIDQSSLNYIHTAEDQDFDYFSFVIDDSEGGFILKTDFVIDVDQSFPSGSEDISQEESKILVYPNPTSDIINIDFLENENSKCQIAIQDMRGRTIIEGQKLSGNQKIDISALSTGMYLMSIRIDGNRTIVRKVIKI